MSSLSLKMEKFLSAPKFAVVGASRDPQKFGSKVLNWYMQHHKNVVPINPSANEIQGVACLKSLSQLPDPKHTSISVITPPDVTLSIIKQAKDLSISSVWLQPGAQDDDVIEFVKAMGMDDRVIYDATRPTIPHQVAFTPVPSSIFTPLTHSALPPVLPPTPAPSPVPSIRLPTSNPTTTTTTVTTITTTTAGQTTTTTTTTTTTAATSHENLVEPSGTSVKSDALTNNASHDIISRESIHPITNQITSPKPVPAAILSTFTTPSSVVPAFVKAQPGVLPTPFTSPAGKDRELQSDQHWVSAPTTMAGGSGVVNPLPPLSPGLSTFPAAPPAQAVTEVASSKPTPSTFTTNQHGVLPSLSQPQPIFNTLFAMPPASLGQVTPNATSASPDTTQGNKIAPSLPQNHTFAPASVKSAIRQPSQCFRVPDVMTEGNEVFSPLSQPQPTFNTLLAAPPASLSEVTPDTTSASPHMTQSNKTTPSLPQSHSSTSAFVESADGQPGQCFVVPDVMTEGNEVFSPLSQPQPTFNSLLAAPPASLPKVSQTVAGSNASPAPCLLQDGNRVLSEMSS